MTRGPNRDVMGIFSDLTFKAITYRLLDFIFCKVRKRVGWTNAVAVNPVMGIFCLGTQWIIRDGAFGIGHHAFQQSREMVEHARDRSSSEKIAVISKAAHEALRSIVELEIEVDPCYAGVDLDLTQFPSRAG